MLERLKRRVLFSRPFRTLIGWGQRIVLPGFEGFSLYAISRFFFNAIGQGHLITRASAISFKLFMAFFPALIVLLTLIPYIPVEDFQNKLLMEFSRMLPLEVFEFLRATLEDLLVRKHSTLLSVSFIVGLYLASNSMDAILNGFSESNHITTWHTPLKQRLLSVGLLVAFTVMIVLAIVMLTVSGSLIDWVERKRLITDGLGLLGLELAKWTISLFLVLTSISLLYNAGDPTAKRLRIFTPGSIVATFLFVVVAKALAYFFANFTDYNALYGSIGAILAVQFWLYLNMIVLLVGFELNTSIVKARIEHGNALRMSVR